MKYQTLFKWLVDIAIFKRDDTPHPRSGSNTGNQSLKGQGDTNFMIPLERSQFAKLYAK